MQGRILRTLPTIKVKYWLIVLAFNRITAIINAVAASGGTYYCRWIFGGETLVGLIGTAGLLATIIGFAVSQPMISKLGVTPLADRKQARSGG